MTARRLNGWQRLWAVVSVLIGVSLMLVGEKLVPTEESLTTKFSKPIEEDRRYLADLQQHQGKNDAFSRDFFPTSQIPIVETRIQTLQTQYSKEQRSLWRDQFAIRGVIAGVWIAVCLVLYGLGAVVGWVIKGFRPTKRV